MGLGPPKVMKSTFCSATTLAWKHRPPLCHLDRSAAKWRDLCVDALSWECSATERSVVDGPAVSPISSKARRRETAHHPTLVSARSIPSQAQVLLADLIVQRHSQPRSIRNLDVALLDHWLFRSIGQILPPGHIERVVLERQEVARCGRAVHIRHTTHNGVPANRRNLRIN